MGDDERELAAGAGESEPFAGDDVEILDIEAVEEEGGAGADIADFAAAPPAAAPEEGEPTAELAELKNRHLRLLADFDNYRKRSDREREELARFALAEPVRDLLPVVDNLSRALAASGQLEDLRRGIEMTARQLTEVLKRWGVEEVPAVGHPFDPRMHEAVMRVESADVDEPTVVEEFQRGFLLRGRLLRPAMVKVAVGREAGGPGAAGPRGGAGEDG